MKILITGNLGYLGPVVVHHLKTVRPDCFIAGYDTGYFSHCLTRQSRISDTRCDVQYFGDIRTIPISLIHDFEAVVLLAAVSNDPMGSEFEAATHDINTLAYQRLLEQMPIRNKKIIFASSCSVYGNAGARLKKETDPLDPLTAYARSKISVEHMLARYQDTGATLTSLRFATACGMSDRLRLDLVLNDFVASALATGQISLLSDGLAWRPLIHVCDMARAIEWALSRDYRQGDSYVRVNVGQAGWSYQIKDLAQAVASEIPGATVHVTKQAVSDERSYQVDFSLYESLAPDYQPQMSLSKTVQELVAGLRSINFADPNFRASDFIRLNVLKRYRAEGLLNPDLYWSEEARGQT